jgi:hypothetical protein
VLNYLKVRVKYFQHDLPNQIQFQTYKCKYQKNYERIEPVHFRVA